MIKEEILPFLNKTVRLVKGNNFVLTGKILQVNNDSILFETNQATSLISINSIKEIVLPKEKE
jgi:hypothetical protein